MKNVPKLTIHLLSPILCVPKKLTNQVYPSCNTNNQNKDNSISISFNYNKEEIEALDAKNTANPELREAHKALAREIITDLHGAAEYEKAVNISNALFSGNVKELSLADVKIGFKDVPTVELSDENTTVIDLLVNNKICSSKREAREFLNAGSITLNGDKVTDENLLVTKALAIEGEVIVLRRGKKKNYIVKFA